MLRIRLSRVGKRKQPSYRLVVTDSRNPRSGAHLEIVGHVNPLTDPATISLKEERLVYWLQVGAQPSDTAAKLLTKAGVMEKAGKAPVVYHGKEVPPVEKKGKKAEAEVAAPAPAPAAPQAKAEAPAPAAPAPVTEASAAEQSPSEAAPAPEEPSAEEAAPAEETPAEEPAAAEEPPTEEPTTQEAPE